MAKNAQIGEIDLKRILFVDTETSGISGGTGTFAFLIGIGYFDNACFRVAQYFMNDLNEEHPLLFELNQFMNEFRLVVSYNGKSFDVPVLASRNIYHRIESPLTQLHHLDLLHAVRRHWKNRLPDCSLNTAEQYLLQVVRTGDVPGYLIPHLYFSFLQYRNVEALKPVFYHNQQDVLSMAGLLTKVMQVFEDPLSECRAVHDVLAVGKVYESLNQYENALSIYEDFLENSPFPASDKRELLFQMGFNHKKLENWRHAAEVWHDCMTSEAFHPVPYIELAKHYEHRKNDFVAAKKLVEKGLKEIEVLEALESNDKWSQYKDDLEYRKQRLTSKIQKFGTDNLI